METKVCIKCGKEYPIEDFQIRESGRRRGECKYCHNEYQRMRYLDKHGKFKRDVRKEKRESDPKKCVTCGEFKPLSEFTFHNRKKGQHRNRCHECEKEGIRQYHKSPQGKEKRKEWVGENKERIEAYFDLYKKDPRYKENMKRYSRKSVLKTFGITHEDYDRMFREQKGVCAICGNNKPDASGRRKNLCVDHCHTTGRIRGLLCHSCNVTIGLMKESPLLLRKAAEYLENESP